MRISTVSLARPLLLGSLLCGLLGTSGCVERLLQVRSDPPGATVHVNGTEVGKTPLSHSFTFYGTYDVILRREEHFSHRQFVAVEPPWYQQFPLDFFSELVVPWKITDEHALEVTLVRVPKSISEETQTGLTERARELQRKLLDNGPASAKEDVQKKD